MVQAITITITITITGVLGLSVIQYSEQNTTFCKMDLWNSQLDNRQIPEIQ